VTAFSTQTLGVVFVVVGAVATFLMFHLCGYPFDKEELKSEAPATSMLLHRSLGYLYLFIYVYLMWQMVPRMWTYQIELPARTVAHLLLGMTIGAVLLVKVVVVRFFKHLEGMLAPGLGTLLFVCSVVLVGLAAPFSFREQLLGQTALAGGMLDPARVERLRALLPAAGVDEAEVADLTSSESILAGRLVLIGKCVQCHDLRTVLARPRTPESWSQIVHRMAERSSVVDRISELEQRQVLAYLIAVTPTLQSTRAMQRQQDLQVTATREAMQEAQEQAWGTTYDADAARTLFESRCSQCHSLSRVTENPPTSAEGAVQLVSRMVGNGLSASAAELSQIIRYLTETYSGGDPTGGRP
jgi:mono/diheme cytochrome c family protein